MDWSKADKTYTAIHWRLIATVLPPVSNRELHRNESLPLNFGQIDCLKRKQLFSLHFGTDGFELGCRYLAEGHASMHNSLLSTFSMADLGLTVTKLDAKTLMNRRKAPSLARNFADCRTEVYWLSIWGRGCVSPLCRPGCCFCNGTVTEGR